MIRVSGCIGEDKGTGNILQVLFPRKLIRGLWTCVARTIGLKRIVIKVQLRRVMESRFNTRRKRRKSMYAFNILSLDVFSERERDAVMVGWL